MDDSNIKVAIRVRPCGDGTSNNTNNPPKSRVVLQNVHNRRHTMDSNLAQKKASIRATMDVIGSTQIIVNHTASDCKKFLYDYVASAQSSQEDVWSNVGLTITDGILDGFNGTIIAYGQTGSGKTYTMFGEDGQEEDKENQSSPSSSSPSVDRRGLVPRILEYIWAHIYSEEHRCSHKSLNANMGTHNDTGEDGGWGDFDTEDDDEAYFDATLRAMENKMFCVKASMCEIYNESVYDLLVEDAARHNKALSLRDHPEKGVFIEGISEEVLSSPEHAKQIVSQGLKNRHTSATLMNRHSSRGHAIFILSIYSTIEKDGVRSCRSSKFTLVDLAGSERQRRAQTSEVQLREAGQINKSLSELGNVIHALTSVNRDSSSNDSTVSRYIQYRNSKLTFLLRDSLGGNSKTALIANVTQDDSSIAESLITLKFAQRAKKIRNSAKVNEQLMEGTVEALQKEIAALKNRIAIENMASASGFLSVYKSFSDSIIMSPLSVTGYIAGTSRLSRSSSSSASRHSSGTKSLSWTPTINPQHYSDANRNGSVTRNMTSPYLEHSGFVGHSGANVSPILNENSPYPRSISSLPSQYTENDAMTPNTMDTVETKSESPPFPSLSVVHTALPFTSPLQHIADNTTSLYRNRIKLAMQRAKFSDELRIRAEVKASAYQQRLEACEKLIQSKESLVEQEGNRADVRAVTHVLRQEFEFELMKQRQIAQELERRIQKYCEHSQLETEKSAPKSENQDFNWSWSKASEDMFNHSLLQEIRNERHHYEQLLQAQAAKNIQAQEALEAETEAETEAEKRVEEEALVKQCEDLQVENASLQQEKDFLKTFIEEMQNGFNRRLNEAHQKFLGMCKSMEMLRKERDEVVSMADVGTDMKNLLQLKEKEYDIVYNEKIRTTEQVKELQTVVQDFQKQIHDLEIHASNTSNEEQLERHLMHSQDTAVKMEQLATENTRLQVQLEAITAKRQHTVLENEWMKDEIESLLIQCDHTLAQKDELRKSNGSLEGVVEKHKQELVCAQQQIDKLYLQLQAHAESTSTAQDEDTSTSTATATAADMAEETNESTHSESTSAQPSPMQDLLALSQQQRERIEYLETSLQTVTSHLEEELHVKSSLQASLNDSNDKQLLLSQTLSEVTSSTSDRVDAMEVRMHKTVSQNQELHLCVQQVQHLYEESKIAEHTVHNELETLKMKYLQEKEKWMAEHQEMHQKVSCMQKEMVAWRCEESKRAQQASMVSQAAAEALSFAHMAKISERTSTTTSTSTTAPVQALSSITPVPATTRMSTSTALNQSSEDKLQRILLTGKPTTSITPLTTNLSAFQKRDTSSTAASLCGTSTDSSKKVTFDTVDSSQSTVSSMSSRGTYSPEDVLAFENIVNQELTEEEEMSPYKYKNLQRDLCEDEEEEKETQQAEEEKEEERKQARGDTPEGAIRLTLRHKGASPSTKERSFNIPAEEPLDISELHAEEQQQQTSPSHAFSSSSQFQINIDMGKMYARVSNSLSIGDLTITANTNLSSSLKKSPLLNKGDWNQIYWMIVDVGQVPSTPITKLHLKSNTYTRTSTMRLSDTPGKELILYSNATYLSLRGKAGIKKRLLLDDSVYLKKIRSHKYNNGKTVYSFVLTREKEKDEEQEREKEKGDRDVVKFASTRREMVDMLYQTISQL